MINEDFFIPFLIILKFGQGGAIAQNDKNTKLKVQRSKLSAGKK